MVQNILRTMARALETQGIEYMIIGGQAVLLYGEPRLTKDIDITVGAGIERLSDVADIVYNLGWRILVEDIESFVRKTMVLPCLEPATGIRVDFIFSFSPYELHAIQRAKRVPLEEVTVRYVSLEDLIIQKIVAGRPRDLDDIQGLLLKNDSVDTLYIRKWLLEFERTLDRKFVSVFDELVKKLNNP